MYAMAYNKRLDFAQLFFNQLVKYVTRNKNSTYVPYPCWLGLFLARDEEGYNVNHGVIILIPALSSKIINACPYYRDMNLTKSMEKWVANL